MIEIVLSVSVVTGILMLIFRQWLELIDLAKQIRFELLSLRCCQLALSVFFSFTNLSLYLPLGDDLQAHKSRHH